MITSSNKDKGAPPPPLMDLVPPPPMIDPCNTLMWEPEMDMLVVTGAQLLHTYALDKQGWEILTYIPTQKFFELHKEPITKKLFKKTNMDGYFRLRPWGTRFTKGL